MTRYQSHRELLTLIRTNTRGVGVLLSVWIEVDARPTTQTHICCFMSFNMGETRQYSGGHGQPVLPAIPSQCSFGFDLLF